MSLYVSMFYAYGQLWCLICAFIYQLVLFVMFLVIGLCTCNFHFTLQLYDTCNYYMITASIGWILGQERLEKMASVFKCINNFVICHTHLQSFMQSSLFIFIFLSSFKFGIFLPREIRSIHDQPFLGQLLTFTLQCDPKYMYIFSQSCSFKGDHSKKFSN